jgi:hypothetical protein
MPSKHEALSSNPSTAKNKTKQNSGGQQKAMENQSMAVYSCKYQHPGRRLR